MSTMLDYALSYAQNGLKVFPLQPRGKAPLGKLVPNGQHDATNNEARIRDWWKVVPEANIGMPMRENGFICFDCDPRNGYTEASWGAPEGVTIQDIGGLWQSTGGGGYHVLFDHPGNATSPGKIGSGLDVKDKGYVVVFPSVHPSGDRYKWLEGVSRRAPVPQWLLERMETSPDKDVFPLPNGAVIPEGERNTTLFLAACSLRSKGFDEPEIRAFLLATNYRMDPPMEESEMIEIARQVCDRYSADNPIWNRQKNEVPVAKNREVVAKNRGRVTLNDLYGHE